MARKGGHRRGRALINIRSPDLEGKRGDLKSEPHQHQHQAEQEDLIAAELRRHSRQHGEVQRVRDAIDQRDAIHGEGGGERADDQVFDAGLKRGNSGALEAGQHIEGDRDEFQRHEQEGEVIRRRGKQHPRQGKQDQRIELGDASLDAVGEFDRHQEDDESGQQEQALEEQRQAVEGIHLAEGILHRLVRADVDAAKAVEQYQPHTDGGGATEPTLGGQREPQIRKQQPQPQGQHQKFMTEQQ